jgi:hypothetical protein
VFDDVVDHGYDLIQNPFDRITTAIDSNRRLLTDLDYVKKSWTQCYLPMPFAKCVVWYGEPMLVPKEISTEDFEKLRVTLELRMQALKREVEDYFTVSQKTFKKPSELITAGV